MNEEERAAIQAAFEKAQAVRLSYGQALMAKPNVVGVGVGLRQQAGVRTGTVALVVMVKQKKPASQLSTEEILPSEIEGVPVDVQEVGEIHAQ